MIRTHEIAAMKAGETRVFLAPHTADRSPGSYAVRRGGGKFTTSRGWLVETASRQPKTVVVVYCVEPLPPSKSKGRKTK